MICQQRDMGMIPSCFMAASPQLASEMGRPPLLPMGTSWPGATPELPLPEARYRWKRLGVSATLATPCAGQLGLLMVIENGLWMFFAMISDDHWMVVDLGWSGIHVWDKWWLIIGNEWLSHGLWWFMMVHYGSLWLTCVLMAEWFASMMDTRWLGKKCG